MSMYPRTNYEMTQEDLDKILDACKAVPYLVIGGRPPASPQENANLAWAELGRRMGFDHMTVQPGHGGNRFFTAIPSETPEQRKERELREKEDRQRQEVERIKSEISALENKLTELLKP